MARGAKRKEGETRRRGERRRGEEADVEARLGKTDGGAMRAEEERGGESASREEPVTGVERTGDPIRRGEEWRGERKRG